MRDKQEHQGGLARLDQNVLARYATVAPASILGSLGWPLFGGRTARSAPVLPFSANVALENRD